MLLYPKRIHSFIHPDTSIITAPRPSITMRRVATSRISSPTPSSSSHRVQGQRVSTVKHARRVVKSKSKDDDDDDASDDGCFTPEWAKDLVLNEDGDLVDTTTGKPLNEFGATRFDVYVRALRGEYDVPSTENDAGEIFESIQQFPCKYTFQIVVDAKDAQDATFTDGLIREITGQAGELKAEVVFKPRGKKFTSIWVTCFVFSARETNEKIQAVKANSKVKMCF